MILFKDSIKFCYFFYFSLKIYLEVFKKNIYDEINLRENRIKRINK